MKLFLSSLSISGTQTQAFCELVGKDAGDISFALIENAADAESGEKSWVLEHRQMMIDNGFRPTLIDLEEYRETGVLEDDFHDFDVIYCGGGNTFHLRYILHETGMDEAIRHHVARGKVYGGSSAGAIVSGPTLKYVEYADDISAVAQPVIEGLGLTKYVVAPHYQSSDYGESINKLIVALTKDGFETIPITDEQAVLISDGNLTVIS